MLILFDFTNLAKFIVFVLSRLSLDNICTDDTIFVPLQTSLQIENSQVELRLSIAQ